MKPTKIILALACVAVLFTSCKKDPKPDPKPGVNPGIYMVVGDDIYYNGEKWADQPKGSKFNESTVWADNGDLYYICTIGDEWFLYKNTTQILDLDSVIKADEWWAYNVVDGTAYISAIFYEASPAEIFYKITPNGKASKIELGESAQNKYIEGIEVNAAGDPVFLMQSEYDNVNNCYNFSLVTVSSDNHISEVGLSAGMNCSITRDEKGNIWNVISIEKGYEDSIKLYKNGTYQHSYSAHSIYTHFLRFLNDDIYLAYQTNGDGYVPTIIKNGEFLCNYPRDPGVEIYYLNDFEISSKGDIYIITYSDDCIDLYKNKDKLYSFNNDCYSIALIE